MEFVLLTYRLSSSDMEQKVKLPSVKHTTIVMHEPMKVLYEPTCATIKKFTNISVCYIYV